MVVFEDRRELLVSDCDDADIVVAYTIILLRRYDKRRVHLNKKMNLFGWQRRCDIL